MLWMYVLSFFDEDTNEYPQHGRSSFQCNLPCMVVWSLSRSVPRQDLSSHGRNGTLRRTAYRLHLRNQHLLAGSCRRYKSCGIIVHRTDWLLCSSPSWL
jgi:hypothetical protein